MKEAAGEANMTVVTIVLIAVVLGAGTLIVTNLVRGMSNNRSTRCAQIGGFMDNGTCRCTVGGNAVNVSGASATACDGTNVTF